jgi:hypothetical protein
MLIERFIEEVKEKNIAISDIDKRKFESIIEGRIIGLNRGSNSTQTELFTD